MCHWCVIPQQLFTAVDFFSPHGGSAFCSGWANMIAGKISDRLIKVASNLVSSIRGGLAIAAVAGAFCDFRISSPATVVAVGSIMIPASTQKLS